MFALWCGMLYCVSVVVHEELGGLAGEIWDYRMCVNEVGHEKGLVITSFADPFLSTADLFPWISEEDAGQEVTCRGNIPIVDS